MCEALGKITEYPVYLKILQRVGINTNFRGLKGLDIGMFGCSLMWDKWGSICSMFCSTFQDTLNREFVSSQPPLRILAIHGHKISQKLAFLGYFGL